jgi:nucleoside-diphosphate-sugar epimerase
VEELDPDALAPIRFSGQLVNTERAVFSAHPTATYFIYPAVYGPRNVVPIEWSVIKRCLDGRTEMVLPDGGLSINSRGAPQNLAHFLLLAIDRPDTSEGQIFNCADDALYSLRQWIQLVLDAMGSTMNIVGVPSEIAPLFRAIYLPPSQHQSPHYVFDTTKARERLGYRDVISPHDAIIESVEWYHSHPVDAAAPPAGFVDRFDYQLEESLIDAWRRAVGDVQAQVPQTIQPEVHSMPHPKVPNQLLDERSR